MKKKITILVAIFTLLLTVNAFAVNINIDGVSVEFTEDSGVPFVDESNRTQVPLRATMEAFGAKVDWDQKNYVAIVEKDGITVKVPIWQSYIYKNDELVFNDTSAMIIDNRTYLPIRVVLEAFGADVDWDGDTQTVIVTKGSSKEEDVEEVKENRYFSDTFSKFATVLSIQPREMYYNGDDLVAEMYIYNGEDTTISKMYNLKITIKDSDNNIVAEKDFDNIDNIKLQSGNYITKTFKFEKRYIRINDADLAFCGVYGSVDYK
jgi:SLAP domain-containing protein